MNPRERKQMMDNIKNKLSELENFSLDFNLEPMLSSMVEKYNVMATNEGNIQTRPDSVSNWEDERDAISTLIELIEDIDIKQKIEVKVEFFTDSTINNINKRKEFIDAVNNMFEPIQTILADIDNMKDDLSDVLDEVIENTEDKVMLEVSHENAEEEREELDDLDFDVCEKYQEILDVLDEVVNGVC